jgi:Ca2+-binding EF-hand superfamily protein
VGQPQSPDWIDGHDPDALPAPTEDLLLEAFDTHDKDNDSNLSLDELAAVIRDAYRRQGESLWSLLVHACPHVAFSCQSVCKREVPCKSAVAHGLANRYRSCPTLIDQNAASTCAEDVRRDATGEEFAEAVGASDNELEEMAREALGDLDLDKNGFVSGKFPRGTSSLTTPIINGRGAYA